MDVTLSVEQERLRETAARYLADRYPTGRIGELADAPIGWDAGGWEPLVRLGWLDPALGTIELAVLAEECGYALLPVPWWATVGLSAPAYEAAGSAPHAPATLGWREDPPDLPGTAGNSGWAGPAGALGRVHRAAGCRTQPGPGGCWRLSGTKRLVPDATGATEMIAPAATAGGVALFRVDLADPAVTVTTHSTVDGLRRMSDVHIAEAEARLLVAPHLTRQTMTRIRWRSLTLLAAEGVGVARRAFDFAAGHARVRRQFGRPIGSYQGVAFRIADSYVALELARSLAYRAASSVDAAGATPTTASMVDSAVAAATVASRRAATRACEEAIQVLGGTGMTWDHPIHRWYRRALWLHAFDADLGEYLEDLATALLG